MNSALAQVRSLWVPLREVNMLLPHAAVAEVGRYRMPRQRPEKPNWLLGSIDWRDQAIPVISLELLCGDTVPHSVLNSRLLIINSVRPDSPVNFYAIVTTGLPRPLLFDSSKVDDFECCDDLPVLQWRVLINGEQAIIPNLDYIQDLLERQLEAAA